MTTILLTGRPTNRSTNRWTKLRDRDAKVHLKRIRETEMEKVKKKGGYDMEE